MDGYMCNRQYTLKNVRDYCLCQRRSTKCNGTVTAFSNRDQPNVGQQRNPDPCQDEIDALRARRSRVQQKLAAKPISVPLPIAK